MHSVAKASKPPLPTLVAVIVLAATFVAGQANLVLSETWKASVSSLLALAFVLGLAALLLHSLYRGKRWARWLALLLIVLGLILLPQQLPNLANFKDRFVYVAQGLVQATSVLLLFLPDSNRWFSRAKAT